MVLAVVTCCLVAVNVAAQNATSPNGKLSVTAKDKGYAVNYNGKEVFTMPVVGYSNAGSNDIDCKALKFVKKVNADYQMITGKRSHCTNLANEYVASANNGQRMVMRVYNDGIALRYEAVDLQNSRELTTFRIPEGAKRWMLQWSDGYEGFYPVATTAKQQAVRSYSPVTKDADGNCLRWGFPALIEVKAAQKAGDKALFALITEANIERGQSAACLYNGEKARLDGQTATDADYELFRVVADETIAGKTADHTPWRVVILGTLGDVVESTLVTDVCEPNKLEDASWVKPGVVSWVYWAYNHGSDDYDIVKKYSDLAATLKLPYMLIDAEWDRMGHKKPAGEATGNDAKTVEDAVAYALSLGVKPMIWYNSSVGWIDGAPTPKFRLNKPEDREKEFAWCEKIGVAGVKIDFFSGDNQRNMDYCIDLMENAARHHLLVNFHGATVPRGWQRTYPNLMSTEGVYGAEWYNNVPTFTNQAACHNATLPFTRNVIGPMDYTPCAFSDSQHPHITTHAHELALTALYESGLQHLADRPESFLAQPQAVQDFLSRLPAAWDETRFVSGYPGESAVIARRSGNTWYIAGINGTDTEKTLSVPLPYIKKVREATLFADSGSKDAPWNIQAVKHLPATITCQPRGGFVIVVKN